MRTRHRALAVGVAGGLAVVLTAAVTSGASAPARGPATVTLDFTTSWTKGVATTIDLGEEGPGVGDLILLTEVPMEDDGRTVGTIEGVETLMAEAHDGTVSQEMTLRLDGGLVMVAGVVRHDTAPFDLAVVGGTGRYLKARGELTFHADDPERKVSEWTLRVTR